MMFRSLANLEILCLRNNFIEEIASTALPLPSNLTELDLKYNDLYEIDDDIFRQQSRLKTLLLGNNYISYIAEMAFTDITYLEELDVSSNELESIPPEALGGLRTSTYWTSPTIKLTS
ncbi:hypothetical protein BSL78_09226 [Apostichopus japonicus]|uniref:Uncharacterized protein n=1 Tax=Stichopus japonicus TaxID=307972 RepID=A0A2G8L0X6_STIJA|nr:hypothetical protein BSL78_09226 [Apostichopus japonicus]